MSEISEKAINLIKDLRRDISIDIMFTPEKNAEDDSLKALVDYIAELEAENTALKQHPQPIEFWSDEKKELYRRNESRTIKSGREEECEE